MHKYTETSESSLPVQDSSRQLDSQRIAQDEREYHIEPLANKPLSHQLEEEQDQNIEDDDSLASSEEIESGLTLENQEKRSLKNGLTGEDHRVSASLQSHQDKDLPFEKFALNRDKYTFLRPILFCADIDKECERISYSYIKVPEGFDNGSINPNNEIALENINQTYMGVPPICPESFRSAKIAYLNPYDQALNSLEDEKYYLDTSLVRKRKLLQILEEIRNINDENAQHEQLEKLIATNRYVKEKVLREDESIEVGQKIQNLVATVQFEISQLLKNRVFSNDKMKKKFGIYLQLSQKHEEMWESSLDRTRVSNKGIIENIFDQYDKLLKTTDPEENPLLTRTQFNELYQVARKETLDALFKNYLRNLNGILPVAVESFDDFTVFSRCYHYIKTYIHDMVYSEKESFELFNMIIGKVLGLELEPLEKVIVTAMNAQNFNQYVSKISSGALKVERLSAKANEKAVLNNTFEQMSQPTDSRTFNVFLPLVQNNLQRAFYGKHYTLFFISLLFEFYKRLHFAKRFSETHTFVTEGESQSSETIYSFYTHLLSGHQSDQIDEATYNICILNIFGRQGVPLLNMKKLLGNIGRNLVNILNDEPTLKILQSYSEVCEEAVDEEKLFKKLLDIHNAGNPDPIGTDKENHTYRFFWSLDTREMFISVFDIKDAISKASKVNSSNSKPKTATNLLGIKTKESKKGIQHNGKKETNQTSQENNEEKEGKQDLSEIEGPLAKKVHIT